MIARQKYDLFLRLFAHNAEVLVLFSRLTKKLNTFLLLFPSIEPLAAAIRVEELLRHNLGKQLLENVGGTSIHSVKLLFVYCVYVCETFVDRTCFVAPPPQIFNLNERRFLCSN